MQWVTFFQKECLENVRNLKWVWVPIVFIMLSVLDPITTYYLPVILESTGGLPEGATFEIPTPSPQEAFLLSFGQLNLLGIAFILLMMMGIISAERKSGVTELIFVKPIRFSSYIMAKWMSTSLLVLSSLSIGLATSWYYVDVLYGDVAWSVFTGALGIYSIWIVFVISISLFANTIFKVPGLVGFTSIVAVLLLTSTNGIVSHYISWYPPQLNQHLREYVLTGVVPETFLLTGVVTISISASLLIGATWTLRQKERSI